MRKLVVAISALLFGVLSVAYIADPTRRHTSEKLVPVGRHTATDNMLSSLNVTAMAQDSMGLVWIGTSAGINVYDGKTYTQFFHDAHDATALPDDYINVIHHDRRGRMWIGTQNGLAMYLGAGRFTRFALPKTDCDVTAIGEADNPDDIIVSTSRHKVCYIVGPKGVRAASAKKAQPITTRTDIPDAPYSLQKPQQLITCSFRDSSGCVWVGFRNAGYQVVSDQTTRFKSVNDNSLCSRSRGKDVTCLARVGDNIIAGTTRRMYVADKTGNNIYERFYNQIFDTVPSGRRELNHAIAFDNTHVWLVGNRQVASCRLNGSQPVIESNAYGSNDLTTVLGSGTKSGKRLFVSSSNGLLSFDYGATTPCRMDIDSQWLDEETQLTTLHDGRVLMFMRNMNIMLYDPNSRHTQALKTRGAPKEGNIDPAFAQEDSYGNVWLGTKRFGLYRLDMRTHKIERMNFLDDVHVQGIGEDPQRRLWITTLKDVVCYDPHTGTATTNGMLSSSVNEWNRQYFDNALCVMPDGRVVLGSSDGCYMFKSGSNETVNKAAPRIYAINITTQRGKQLTLGGNISNGSHYALAHDENTIDISFFTPEYGRATALAFQYRLDGYDRQWHKPTYRHDAQYANLPPGKYVFRLRSVTSAGLSPKGEQTISIRVRPAWWASPAALFAYAVFTLLILYVINSLYLRLRTNNMRLMEEQHERELEKRANEMNMSFFANISHEFRNPITVIAGPLLSLRSDSSLPQQAQNTINRVCMSVNRMLRLIDQMLDFNQLETDALRLRVAHVDAAELLRQLVMTFEESARVRCIALDCDIDANADDVLMDADKFEKIMSNLFTNALKHTPDGGTIRITLTFGRSENHQGFPKAGDADGMATLKASVFNSGSFIPQERIGDVFKRYYQLADTTGSHHYGWGTGIGLYYVHRLVELHHGWIKVENTGQGVMFSFALPAVRDAYDSSEQDTEQKRVMQIPISHSPITEEPLHTADTNPQGSGKERKKILVVDDDTDVATYIKSIFEADFEVVNRYSAEDALADIKETCPDIVLSDIIMGKMSGYEMCRKIKENLATSHIPVVMITAKSNTDEQVHGLRLGAVAYVTKPFDPEYLKALVKSQLDNIQTMRRRLGESTETKQADDISDTISEPDREFMDELYALMKRRSAEMDLNVATVCHDLLISQSKFNYKLKQLTGDTPGVFFRKYKLNRAAQLLSEGTHTVSEVAVMTGFGTAAHFSVAFKKQFGMTPSERLHK